MMASDSGRCVPSSSSSTGSPRAGLLQELGLPVLAGDDVHRLGRQLDALRPGRPDFSDSAPDEIVQLHACPSLRAALYDPRLHAKGPGAGKDGGGDLLRASPGDSAGASAARTVAREQARSARAPRPEAKSAVPQRMSTGRSRSRASPPRPRRGTASGPDLTREDDHRPRRYDGGTAGGRPPSPPRQAPASHPLGTTRSRTRSPSGSGAPSARPSAAEALEVRVAGDRPRPAVADDDPPHHSARRPASRADRPPQSCTSSVSSESQCVHEALRTSLCRGGEAVPAAGAKADPGWSGATQRNVPSRPRITSR